MARLVLGWGWVPLVSALAWFATVLALLIIWLATGQPKYRGNEPDLIYISNVGAAYQWLFILGAVVTSLFFILTLILDRHLRYRDRLPSSKRTRARVDAILAIIFGTTASACLILLTIYDAWDHSTIHWALTLGFMASLVLSAIFTVLQSRWLRKDHPDVKDLKRNFIVKMLVVLLSIALALTMLGFMWVCSPLGPEAPEGEAAAESYQNSPTCNHRRSISAGCEWAVAFLTAVYIATFIVDLVPAHQGSSQGVPQPGETVDDVDLEGNRRFGRGNRVAEMGTSNRTLV
ncbi:hypothetical protein HK097_006967 [Rhizophlyctis rosea]|uniref:CWH43-like N-terminal domain-containing protein n=1 Tax=Rhizophlyctis rosea TaxID=64517 RepID=A0AAD5SDQ9_9FUNG|nr:hypothetical protein HK097_006967 [Rhizophlyctis rosea]